MFLERSEMETIVYFLTGVVMSFISIYLFNHFIKDSIYLKNSKSQILSKKISEMFIDFKMNSRDLSPSSQREKILNDFIRKLAFIDATFSRLLNENKINKDIYNLYYDYTIDIISLIHNFNEKYISYERMSYDQSVYDNLQKLNIEIASLLSKTLEMSDKFDSLSKCCSQKFEALQTEVDATYSAEIKLKNLLLETVRNKVKE